MAHQLISCDDHMDLGQLPADLWETRLPASLLDRAPHVEERDGQKVGEAVVRLFLGVNVSLRTESSTAHEIVGVLEGVILDALDLPRIDRVGFAQLEHAMD